MLLGGLHCIDRELPSTSSSEMSHSKERQCSQNEGVEARVLDRVGTAQAKLRRMNYCVFVCFFLACGLSKLQHLSSLHADCANGSLNFVNKDDDHKLVPTSCTLNRVHDVTSL